MALINVKIFEVGNYKALKVYDCSYGNVSYIDFQLENGNHDIVKKLDYKDVERLRDALTEWLNKKKK
jgi:flagellar basal body-associated protein FliL